MAAPEVTSVRRAPLRVGLVFLVTLSLATVAVASCTPASTSGSGSGGDVTTSITATGFDVSWRAKGGAAGYELRYGVDGAKPAVTTTIATTTTTASIVGLASGRRYKLNVRSISNGGTASDWSPSTLAVFVVPVLPVVRIDTAGQQPILSKETYLPGTFELDAGGGATPLTSTMQIKGHGNSTWNADKKPYRLKLDKSTSMLGITKSKNWVLLADAFDPTHLRNPIAFALGHQTALAWTPQSRQVEVILNGVYEGMYEIAENVRIDDTRVDIDQMSPTDTTGDALTGGYLAEIDNQAAGGDLPTFTTTGGQAIELDDPDPATPEQTSYLKVYLGQFEAALKSSTFADPTTGYAAYLDVPSMIDLYLVNELIRNQDGFLGSTFFTKPRLGKIVMGPLWDFDNSLGNDHGWDDGSATGWFIRRPGVKWLSRLFDDPAFASAVAARWDRLKPLFEQEPAKILTDGAAIAGGLANDRAAWTPFKSPVDTPQKLADWLQTRIDWIDANIHAAP